MNQQPGVNAVKCVTHFIAKLFRFKRYLKVVDYAFEDNGKTLKIIVKPYKNGCRCPECQRRCKIVGYVMGEAREWLDIPVHGITVMLVFLPREIVCPTHGRRQEEIPWAEAFARVTYRLEYAIVRYAQEMTQKAAAALLKIPRSTFSDLLHRIIERVRDGHRIRGLTVVGVDEIAYCRGHKYATIVYDLKRAKVVWVGRGKGKETLEHFMETKLTENQRQRVCLASCDMSQAYIATLERYLVNATIVLDRFHIVKALNEALDEVRKEEWRRVSGDDKLYFKGLRWLLLRGSGTRTKSQTRVINQLRRSNSRIFRAWVLKDEFESFWDYTYRGSAEKFLRSWMTRTLKSRIDPLRRFVETLRRHEHRIMPFIETGLTNAKGEGINRVLQMIKARACGFGTLEAFTDLINLVAGDVDIPAGIPGKFHTVPL